MNWLVMFWKRALDFSGRSRRAEYWTASLLNVLVMIALSVVELVIYQMPIVCVFYAVASIVPSFAVSIRRFHDIGRSGWYLLLGAVPIIGGLIILYFVFQDSEPGFNQYGNNPKGIGPELTVQ